MRAHFLFDLHVLSVCMYRRRFFKMNRGFPALKQIDPPEFGMFPLERRRQAEQDFPF